MDANRLLLWMVFLGGIANQIQMMRIRAMAQKKGWVAVNFFVLILTAALYFMAPASAGFAGGAAWLILMVLPGLGARRLQKYFFRQDFRRASRLSLLLRWLHPGDGWWRQSKLIQAMALVQEGEIAGAASIVSRFQDVKDNFYRMAQANLFIISGRYREFLDWIHHIIGSGQLPQVPDLIRYYLLALAETGEVTAMVREYVRMKKAISHPMYVNHLAFCRLYLFAFTKKTAVVERICSAQLQDLHPDVKRFWLATSRPAGEARPVFAELQKSRLFSIRQAAEERLAAADAGGGLPLDPEIELLLQAEEKEVRDHVDLREKARMFQGSSRPRTTWMLTLAIVAAFMLETISGGSTDSQNLYRLGAMVNRELIQGEWWRLVTSLFLHVGALHLVLNVYALLALGPFVERGLGWLRFLLAYFGTGIVSMYVTSALASEPRLILGASGCIMGLLGATAAILLFGSAGRHSPAARRFLANVIFILVIQTVFDLLTPEVAMSAHLSGFFSGFLLVLLFFRRRLGR